MRVTIMGLGLFGGGLGAALYFAEQGHEVTVTDLAAAETLGKSLDQLKKFKNLRFVLGRHEAADIMDCDLLVASPAVPPSNNFIRQRRQEGGAITTEIELVLKKSKQRVLAVTGSNGKTTTSHMLHELLVARGIACRLTGNVGGSILPEVETLPEDLILVMELSSFQLERIHVQKRPVMGAIVTNISANHLDRHGNMDDYLAAKMRLLHLMEASASLILDADDPGSRTWPERALEFDLEIHPVADADLPNFPRPERLIGRFNHKNLAMAMSLAEAVLGPDRDAAERVARDFRGLPHRLEALGKMGKLLVLNDSKSTTPFATSAAIAALDRPVHLIAGGYDKGLPPEELFLAFDRCARIVVLGATAAALEVLYKSTRGAKARPIERAFGLEEAIALASRDAMESGYLLFSPGHPSYDAYVNFEARGRAFAATLEQFPDFSAL